MYNTTYEYLAKILGGCFLALPVLLLIIAAFYLIVAWPLMLIWNSVLIPTFASVVALPTLGYWQMVWITVFCKLLLSPISLNSNSK